MRHEILGGSSPRPPGSGTAQPGIDNNMFLMTRVREESVQFGTRPGILRGMAVTRRGDHLRRCGAVGHLHRAGCAPAGVLAELGFTVAFGVLLDIFIVRAVLVPALAYDIGPTIRWPSKLSTTGQQLPKPGRPPRTRPPTDAMTRQHHASTP